ncbi:MAG: hypothetical protein PVH28_06900 [Desulfobacterales bacterium]
MFLSITDVFENFFDGGKVHVGQALPHALPVKLKYRVPDSVMAPFLYA